MASEIIRTTETKSKWLRNTIIWMCYVYIFALETYVLNDLAASLVVSVCRSLWYSTLLKQCVRTYENFVNLTISSEKREEKLLQSNTLAFQWARGVHLWLTTALFLRQISETTTKKSTHPWKLWINKVMDCEYEAYKW